MDSIINYFNTIPSSHRGLILVGGITLFWVLENMFPFLKFQYSKIHHASINISFTVTSIVVNFFLAFLLLSVSKFTTDYKFGLLHVLPKINFWVFTLIGLLLLDLIGAYLAYLTKHKVKFLWRFHLIHHTDTWVDTTSANRHHPGESVTRFIFTIFGVLLVGAPMWMVFLYQSLSVVFSQCNHANIILPQKIDIFLSYFIVSPDMHKIHHHYQLPYTDSNYGNIFSVWDRVFGTFINLNRNDLIYGLDTHLEVNENNKIKKLLKIPFQKVRSPQ